MVTTETIREMVIQEEERWYGTGPRQERLRWLTEAMDERRYDDLYRAFTYIGENWVPRNDRPQLWCEAVKFHELRLAGYGFHQAIARMVNFHLV